MRNRVPVGARFGTREVDHARVLSSSRHVEYFRRTTEEVRENVLVPDTPADAHESSVSDASETISQLAAKILSQLSLSAWLPAAALVLIVAFILELGANLKPRDGEVTTATGGKGAAHSGAAEVLSRTVSSIGHTSFAAIMLLVVIIVVATMITQAFSFEAIRFLEGYWGLNRRIDRLTGWLCSRQQKRLTTLSAQHTTLKKAAWKQARAGARKSNLSKPMIAHLTQIILGTYAKLSLTEDEKAKLADFDWQSHVGVDTLRALRNVEKRLADYPRELSYVMATRLGNVLRRHEVETGEKDIETFVERVFHRLPFDMRLSHDEQRARLDLYCSMVFVLWLSAVVAFARFGWWAWPYTVVIVPVCLLGSYVAYRGAVASGRYYGALLEEIAEWNRQRSEVASADAA